MHKTTLADFIQKNGNGNGKAENKNKTENLGRIVLKHLC